MNQVRDSLSTIGSRPKVLLPEIPEWTVRLTDYGAVGDGRTNNSEAFRLAIQACADAGGGKIIIPAGLWLTGPLKLVSRLELHTEAGAVVMFSKQFSDYPMIKSNFEGKPSIRCQSPLDGEGLEHIAITGAGIFDGGGEAWRPVKKWKMTDKQWGELVKGGGVVSEDEVWWPTASAMQGAQAVEQLIRAGNEELEAYAAAKDYLRPNLLSFRRCSRILLEGPTFQNSAAWNLHPWASEHVTIRKVNVRNPWFAQNGDGLDIESCRYVLVEDCTFDVGDDAICLKSGKDEAGRELGIPSEYITIQRCCVYHGHGGFVIGSEMSGGVRQVHVSDCTFMGTDIGLRFKSARGRGGIVEDILVERIHMADIKGEAISFHFFYEGVEGSGTAREEIYPVTEETPVFRKIVIQDVVCSGAQKALLINGLAEMPMEVLTVDNYSASSQQGIICHNAKQMKLNRITLNTVKTPLIKLHQCQDVEISKLAGDQPATEDQILLITGDRSDGIVYKDQKEELS